MSDFHQNGVISTLHNFSHRTLEDIENHYRRLCYGGQTNQTVDEEILDIPKNVEAQRRPSLTDIYMNVGSSANEQKETTNENVNQIQNFRRGSVLSVDM